MKKKNLIGATLILLAALTALQFQNCGQQKDLIASSRSIMNLESMNCKITPKSFATLNSANLPSQFESSKVQISSPSGSSAGVSGKVSALSSIQGTRLPAHHTIGIVFNPRCLENNTDQAAEGLSDLIPPESRLRGANEHLIHSVAVQLKEGMEITELSERAEADPCIVGVSNSGIARAFAQQPSSPNDAGFSMQPYLNVIKAPEAWPFFGDTITQDVVLAVIDTGIQQTHPDLQANLWVNSQEVAGDGQDNDNNGCVDDINGCNFLNATPSGNINDDNSHGTHVSGLAAGKNNNSVGIAGVMGFRIKIMTVKVLGASGSGTVEGIANGIRYAANAGAQVINLSLGAASEIAAIGDAIRFAVNKGTMVVVAAGNSNVNNDSSFTSPASFALTIPQMISVASIDSSSLNRSSFSNYGVQSTHLAAPGAILSRAAVGQARVVTGLYSTLPGSTWGDIYEGNPYGGTSMASPLVAGAAALARGYLHSKGALAASAATPALIKSYLISTATKSNALGSFVEEGRILNIGGLSRKLATENAGGSGTPTEEPACP